MGTSRVPLEGGFGGGQDALLDAPDGPSEGGALPAEKAILYCLCTACNAKGFDPRALRQVVTNLVGNVAAHTPSGSPCEIAVGVAPRASATAASRTVAPAGGDHAPGTASHAPGSESPGRMAGPENHAPESPSRTSETKRRAPWAEGHALESGDPGRDAGAVAELAEDAAPHVVLEVRDRGPGIPDGHAERVFERFYRADESRARGAGGGSGLGLAIVASIATAHGGDVQAEPREGGGTTMRVTLPATSRRGAAARDVAGVRDEVGDRDTKPGPGASESSAHASPQTESKPDDWPRPD